MPNSSIENPWGFARMGKGCMISPYARFYRPENIIIGDGVRIDDFCILSASPKGIHIRSFVHISCYSYIVGQGGCVIGEYSAISGKVGIYTSNDDYSGEGLTNPMVPDVFRNTLNAPVHINRHSIVGAGSVILPGVTLHLGAAIGSQSLVKEDIPKFQIWAGVPARFIKHRLRNVLCLEEAHQEMLQDSGEFLI